MTAFYVSGGVNVCHLFHTLADVMHSRPSPSTMFSSPALLAARGGENGRCARTLARLRVNI